MSDNSPSAFVLELPSLVEPQVAAKIGTGVFIAREGLGIVAEHYRKWLGEVTGKTISYSDEKCIRRLFHGDLPRLEYFVCGKLVILGYQLSLGEVKPPWSNPGGLFLDAEDFLHPQDPSLENMPFIKIKKTALSEVQTICSVLGNEYLINESFLRQFHCLRKELGWLSRSQPHLGSALRDSLVFLPEFLRQSHKLKKKTPLLVPQILKAQTNRLYFKNGAMVFSSNELLELDHSYVVFGDGFPKFVKSELDLLESHGIPKHLSGTEVYSHPGRNILGLSIRKELRLDVTLSTLCYFLTKVFEPKNFHMLSKRKQKPSFTGNEQSRKSSLSSGLLPESRFSIADALSLLKQSMLRSVRLDRSTTTAVLKELKLPENCQVRKDGPWLYALHKKQLLRLEFRAAGSGRRHSC